MADAEREWQSLIELAQSPNYTKYALESEYCLFHPAQLKTRIEAFIETLQ